MVRNTLLISFAILIDLLQAGISAGLFAVGAFPGTVAGGAAGCALGTYYAGSVGCVVVGSIAGFVGTAGNVVAAATLPIAIALGFAVNFCLDVTLGTILVMWLMWEGMYYPRYGIGGFIAELMPGLSDLPAWTVMTILSVVRKSAEEGKLRGTPAASLTKMMSSGLAGAGVSLVTSIKQGNMETARNVGSYTEEQQTQEGEHQQERMVNSELKNIDGIRAPRTQPSNDNTAPKSLQYEAA